MCNQEIKDSAFSPLLHELVIHVYIIGTATFITSHIKPLRLIFSFIIRAAGTGTCLLYLVIIM